MTGLLDGVIRCSKHNCPMLRIGDDYCCVIGYTNDRIGKQQVMELVMPDSEDEPPRLVFANDYALPLLCPCCGEPLSITDPVTFNDIARGLHLLAVGYDPGEGDIREAFEIVLAPGDTSLPDDPSAPLPDQCQVLALHLDSVKGLYQEQIGDRVIGDKRKSDKAIGDKAIEQ